MKNKYTYFAALAASGVILTALPLLGNAQTRMQNAENNRDIRNVQLNQDGGDRMMPTSTRPQLTQRPVVVRPPLVMPRWLSDPKNAWRNNLGVGTSSNSFRDAYARFASSTEFRNRQDWREARIDKFALIQSNIIFKLNQALSRLRAVRVKLAYRISIAEKNGRPMTDEKSLLAIADLKILDAVKAVGAVASYIPPVLGSGQTQIDASATVSLEKPRELGKTAIQALRDTREALNDVVVAIAHSLGLEADENTAGTQ